ncbi:MAG: S-layer homology domain-containing protein, partial [Cohnella sp.]|nr:S-layer homology domain-containing protein [Cohnella sp.]
IEIIVDGVKQERLATARKSQVNGRTVTTVVLDSGKIADKLDRDNSKLITIPVTGDSQDVVGQLNVGLVRKMQEKGASVQIQTDRATYTLPASQIDADDILSRLGQGANPEDIKVNIRISATTSDNQDKAQSGALQLGAQLLLQPVDFEITVAYGAQSIEANKFNSYVERSIVIPEGVDPSMITTGVVLSPDGSLSHVPTVVTQENGHYYATINSLTNSTYTVIFNPRTMSDVNRHWAKDDVNDLSSRLIINGISETAFAPDASITRAEFAAIVTRGLGIRSAAYAGGFSDVASTDLHAGTVQAAADYKLIAGYDDGTFRPNALITRREAAVVLARAAAIAKLRTDLSAEEMDRSLSAFSDGDKVAGWSRASVAAAVQLHLLQGSNGKLDLEANLTRAETAALVRRLLRAANLID